LVNMQVTKKPRLESIPDIDCAIQESERRLNGCGRVLIRYSGTEPLLRIMVEGEQSTMVKEVAEELARVVRKHIG
jgi:phosphoglucosamine mutase